jgi:integrase/recombinase XerD
MSARPDLDALWPSWRLALRAERKSPATVRSYVMGVRMFLDYCTEQDMPAVLDRLTVNAYAVSLLNADREPGTVATRLLALRRFSAWLVEEGEQETDALLGLRGPKIDEKLVQPLTDDDIRLMIKTCAGKSLRDRRDEAIIRLMFETGARASEAALIKLADLNLAAGTVILRKTKGGRERLVPFGPQTARAIDRYLRARRTAKHADTSPDLWLGVHGKTFGYSGLYKSLTQRAASVGIKMHPHLLRHTAADRWLSAGGSEGGLMAVAGWKRADMLNRYTRARASMRAADEARALNLGDL